MGGTTGYLPYTGIFGKRLRAGLTRGRGDGMMPMGSVTGKGTTMWIQSLTLHNIRSFIKQSIEFSNTVNILVGPNNAGKSTILLPILGLQEQLPTFQSGDVRVDAQRAGAKVELVFSDDSQIRNYIPEFTRIWYGLQENTDVLVLMGHRAGHAQEAPQIRAREPHNLICPFLSLRKATDPLQVEATAEAAQSVSKNLEFLHAWIDKVATSPHSNISSFYRKACDSILGYQVAVVHAQGGRRAVYSMTNGAEIPVEAMGAGTLNILGLLAQLAGSSGKVFVLEEPENDIHPRALKELLRLVAGKSTDNQFIVTTHSNIVLKELGAVPEGKIFWVSMELKAEVPTSGLREVGNRPTARLKVLADLGYEFSDYELWDAWLILEESSAGTIIRKYLVPWFAQGLEGRLRTVSANGRDQVRKSFSHYNTLFVYLHLQKAYRNKAWVVLDAGDEEAAIVGRMKDTYASSGWREEQFRQWTEHDFEKYYPARFQERVVAIAGIKDRGDKRDAKEALLKDVEEWVRQDQEEAKRRFEESAGDVIEMLRDIQRALDGQS